MCLLKYILISTKDNHVPFLKMLILLYVVTLNLEELHMQNNQQFSIFNLKLHFTTCSNDNIGSYALILLFSAFVILSFGLKLSSVLQHSFYFNILCLYVL